MQITHALAQQLGDLRLIHLAFFNADSRRNQLRAQPIVHVRQQALTLG
jgi:hypothetical protein